MVFNKVIFAQMNQIHSAFIVNKKCESTNKHPSNLLIFKEKRSEVNVETTLHWSSVKVRNVILAIDFI